MTASTITRPPSTGEGGGGRANQIAQRRAEIAVPMCLELVDAVHCRDRKRIAEAMEMLDQPVALVVLAAMVPQDVPVSHLLGWTEELVGPRQRRREPGLAPHGTHAAFNRHKTAHETPCAPCVNGERTYQRLRAQERRDRLKATG